MLSRRTFLGSIAPAFLLSGSVKRAICVSLTRTVDRLRGDNSFPPPQVRTRLYRADVVISLLGVRIFSRQDVGRGFATLHESRAGDRRLLALHFAGGSNPERSHGIHYCGSNEEVVLECSASAQEAAYFGFVSTAANESYQQAREHLMSPNQQLSRYIVVEGLHEPGDARYDKATIELPAPDSPDIGGLIAELRSRFPQLERSSHVFREPDSSTPPTFLYSVLAAIRSGEIRSVHTYVHNASQYRLECEKASDPRMGATLAERKVTNRAGAVTRLTGRIRDLETRHTSTFRLWLDDASQLPLRIEFEPRSYLRIALEYDPALKNQAEESQ